MSDRISVRGIRAHGFHGVLDFERREGQEFIVDIDMDVDTMPAAAGDDLTRTVDYSVVAQLAHDHIAGPPHRLIETLAHHIAESVLRMDGVEAVSVSVHKPHAPIPVPFDDVVVTVSRGR